MLPELNQFIGVPYNKQNTPYLRVLGKDKITRVGVNCQLLVHLVYQEYGISIPVGLWSEEIFYDDIFFRSINLEKDKPHVFDIFCLGPERFVPRRLHLGVYVELAYNGDLGIIHSSYPDGVKCEPLEEILKDPKHSKIHAIKRLIPEFFDCHIKFING